jgi:hypothetical protein
VLDERTSQRHVGIITDLFRRGRTPAAEPGDVCAALSPFSRELESLVIKLGMRARLSEVACLPARRHGPPCLSSRVA